MICATPRGQVSLPSSESNAIPLGYASSFHAIVLVNLGRTTITALDPLEGPGTRNYGPRAFKLAWEMAGREVLVIEQPPPLP